MDEAEKDDLLWKIARAIDAGKPLCAISREGLLYHFTALKLEGLVVFQPTGLYGDDHIMLTAAGLQRLQASRQRRAAPALVA